MSVLKISSPWATPDVIQTHFGPRSDHSSPSTSRRCKEITVVCGSYVPEAHFQNFADCFQQAKGVNDEGATGSPLVLGIVQAG